MDGRIESLCVNICWFIPIQSNAGDDDDGDDGNDDKEGEEEEERRVSRSEDVRNSDGQQQRQHGGWKDREERDDVESVGDDLSRLVIAQASSSETARAGRAS